MKKFMLIMLVALMGCMLTMTAFAVDFEREWTNTVHVSCDEIRDSEDKTIHVCAQDDTIINTPVLPAGTTGCIFWGWASANGSDIEGYSYSIDDGEKVTQPSFRFDTEDAVKAAGPGEYDWRFKVPVPLKDGKQVVRVYADFEDGTSEVVWIAEVTVGDGSTDETPSVPGDEEPPKTGDVDLVLVVAAAGIALTVLLRKKASA